MHYPYKVMLTEKEERELDKKIFKDFMVAALVGIIMGVIIMAPIGIYIFW